MTDEDKAWIDNAGYQTMLHKWRFTPSGEGSMFHGDTGKYYAKVMCEKKDALPIGKAVYISKAVAM